LEQRIYKKISKDEAFSNNAQKFPVKPNKKYKTSAKIIGKKGLPYSSYFMISIQGKDGEEIKEHIRWINDFGGNPKEYTIIFTTPPESKNVILGYRINLDTPVRSDIEIDLPSFHSVNLHEVNSKEFDEVFDDRINFEVPSMPPLSSEDEDELEKRMTWVFGSGRSGTTWLAQRLLNHSDNFYWNEPWIGRHLGVSNRIVDVKTGKQKIERVYDKMGKTQHTYFFYPGHKKNWLPAMRKFILARTYSESQTIKKNVIIKEPVGSTAADILMECLPQSKMIFLTRDGRDVVDSRIAMHGENTWAKLKPILPKNRLKRITDYCYDWVDTINIVYKAYQNHSKNLRLLVNYEDLRTDTLRELKKVYEFLGINVNKGDLKNIVTKFDFENIPPSKKGKGKFNRSALVGGWKNNFNKEEQKLMNSIMGETLEQLGYKDKNDR